MVLAWHTYKKLQSVYLNIYLFENIEFLYNNFARVCIAVFVPADIKHSHYLNVLLKYIRVEEKKIKYVSHPVYIIWTSKFFFKKREGRKCQIGASFGKMFGIR